MPENCRRPTPSVAGMTLLSLLMMPLPALPAPDGAALYARHCASCHEHGDGHVPSREALAVRSASYIMMTLKTGAMQPQAAGLSIEEARAIAAYLTAGAAAQSPAPRPHPCSAPLPRIRVTAAGWNGWGRDLANTRFEPLPGLAPEQVPRLQLKWAFAYPGLMTWGQPTVVDGRVFVTSTTGQIYMLDASTGCTLWYVTGIAPVRTAITVGPGAGSHAIVYYGDVEAIVHAMDADTGDELWQRRVDEHPFARVTGTPVLADGRLLVPVSSYEEGAAAAADYACCTFRGSVVALDAATGRALWKRRTIEEEPHPYRRPGMATQLRGPAGASVWGAPTVDLARGVLYLGTGNDYTDVPARATDAVLAIGLAQGELRWTRQLKARDSWESGCAFKGPCPQPAGLDADISASIIAVHLREGREVLVAGSKSGIVYGLDPEAGKLLWQTPVGAGGVFGGIEWGMAAADGRVFVPISDSLPNAPSAARPGLAALDAATGRQLWWTPAPPPQCAWGAADCRGALSQAVTAIPGIVFAGSQDGHLRAYDARTGQIVWQFDTGGSFVPVNARAAHGGSLDAGGPVVADGVLYVNSGYGQFLGRGGNVLLAISVDGK
jgi:polyvinyl alcohol dehydrogenase (cytochrome)